MGITPSPRRSSRSTARRASSTAGTVRACVVPCAVPTIEGKAGIGNAMHALRLDHRVRALPRTRCGARAGADEISEQAGQDPRALCGGRPDRRGGAAVCRAAAARRCAGAVVVENKPGASGIIAIEEMARARPDGHTLMIGNISTNGLTPVLLAKKMRIDYDKDVQIVARLADAPVFFLATTTDFPPKTFAEFLALRQGASRQRALWQRRDRQLSAGQHRDPGEARRARAAPHPVQGRRRADHPGPRQRRHPGVVVQHHQPGRHDQGRQRAPARDRGPAAAAAISRTCRRSRRSAFPA